MRSVKNMFKDELEHPSISGNTGPLILKDELEKAIESAKNRKKVKRMK